MAEAALGLSSLPLSSSFLGHCEFASKETPKGGSSWWLRVAGHHLLFLMSHLATHHLFSLRVTSVIIILVAIKGVLGVKDTPSTFSLLMKCLQGYKGLPCPGCLVVWCDDPISGFQLLLMALNT